MPLQLLEVGSRCLSLSRTHQAQEPVLAATRPQRCNGRREQQPSAFQDRQSGSRRKACRSGDGQQRRPRNPDLYHTVPAAQPFGCAVRLPPAPRKGGRPAPWAAAASSRRPHVSSAALRMLTTLPIGV